MSTIIEEDRKGGITIVEKPPRKYKQYLYGMFLGMVGCVGFAIGIFIMLVVSGTNIDVAHYYVDRPECKMVYTMGIKDNGHVGLQWKMRCR